MLYPEQCSDPVTLNLQLMETVCLHFWHSTRETNRGRKKKHPNPNKSHLSYIYKSASCEPWSCWGCFSCCSITPVCTELLEWAHQRRSTPAELQSFATFILQTCNPALCSLLWSVLPTIRTLSLPHPESPLLECCFAFGDFPFVSKNRAKTG